MKQPFPDKENSDAFVSAITTIVKHQSHFPSILCSQINIVLSLLSYHWDILPEAGTCEKRIILYLRVVDVSG